MKNFNDLEFKAHPSGWGSVQAKMFFDNGYGVSVIQGGMSYTSGDTYELAVLSGTSDKWHLTYDTPITDDVLGHLSEGEVSSIMLDVQSL